MGCASRRGRRFGLLYLHLLKIHVLLLPGESSNK
jgi:hypothetical protein